VNPFNRFVQQSRATEQTEKVFKLLRRKPDTQALTAALQELEILLQTSKASATDTQNERHIHIESKVYTVKKRISSIIPRTDRLISTLLSRIAMNTLYSFQRLHVIGKICRA
jgi:hypothetical protein